MAPRLARNEPLSIAHIKCTRPMLVPKGIRFTTAAKVCIVISTMIVPPLFGVYFYPNYEAIIVFFLAPFYGKLKVKVDLGYQGIKSDYQADTVEIPYKKPRSSKKNPNPQLSDEQKAYNHLLSKARIYVENAICGMKRFRILVNASRNRLNAFTDSVVAVCAGLWNAFIA